MARTEGLETLKRFERLQPKLQEKLPEILNAEADDMVGALQAAAPESDSDPHPGATREAVQKVARNSPLEVAVECDPVDAKGHHYAPHDELGHRTKGGAHVPPHPWFYPTVRIRKKLAKARIARKARALIKQLYG